MGGSLGAVCPRIKCGGKWPWHMRNLGIHKSSQLLWSPARASCFDGNLWPSFPGHLVTLHDECLKGTVRMSECPTLLQREGLKFTGRKGIVLLSISEILLAVPEPGPPLCFLPTTSCTSPLAAFGCPMAGHVCPWVQTTCNFCFSTRVALGSAEGLSVLNQSQAQPCSPCQGCEQSVGQEGGV